MLSNTEVIGSMYEKSKTTISRSKGKGHWKNEGYTMCTTHTVSRSIHLCIGLQSNQYIHVLGLKPIHTCIGLETVCILVNKEARVAKCQQYDVYSRVKIFTCWGKESGRT